MFLRLLAAFIFIPLIELILLLRLADVTSWLVTLAIVVSTGVLGTYLARREGVAAWFRFQEALSGGKIPGREIQDGMMIGIAAILLLTPGLLTDTVGFILLTPWGRRVIGGYFRKRFAGSFQFRSSNESFGYSREPDTFSPDLSSGDNDDPKTGNSRWTIDAPSFRPKG